MTVNDKKNNKVTKIGFFGTSNYSVMTLESLAAKGYDVRFAVTMPDKPKGRGMILRSPPVKEWAIANNVPFFQPETLRNNDALVGRLGAYECDVFITIAYGKIIPEEILNIPPRKSLNIHASLLPKFRGSCPIESAILADEKKTGVTIIRMNAKMDEGPIVATKEIVYEPWPPTAEELGVKLVHEGIELLIQILPNWLSGKIKENPQDNSKATYTKKIVKEDGLLNLKDDGYLNFLKIQAYHEWPRAYFLIENGGKKTRVKITGASFKSGRLIIERVIPESDREMDYEEFLRKSEGCRVVGL